MTGSYFRGDAVPVLSPADEARFEPVTYTYYEQLNGYEHLKSLEIGYFFYAGSYLDAIMKVLDPALKTIVHIPNVNARESTKDKIKEADEIMDALGTRLDGRWRMNSQLALHVMAAILASGKDVSTMRSTGSAGASKARVIDTVFLRLAYHARHGMKGRC